MSTRPTRSVAALTAAACIFATIGAAQVALPRAASDVLERPAQASELAARRLLIGMARAGDRYVAVGARGHVVVSSDGGQTWQQSSVPVSSDLTAVHFPSPTHGWAVGHDGVVIASTDGGITWNKQLDGFAVNDLVLADLNSKLAADPASERLRALAAEAQRYKEQGADKPFLDVWFENERHGFVVGAYNLILETTDGGRTWQSWFERVPNVRFMSLYSIRPAAGALFVSGEAGAVFRLDPGAQRFEAVPVDYRGSLFGVVDAGDAVLVVGLRGNIFRSEDHGRHWSRVESPLSATIVAGATLAPGTVVLADQGGRLARSTDGGRAFTPLPLPLPKAPPLAGVIDAGDGKFGLAGPFGVMVIAPGAAPAR